MNVIVHTWVQGEGTSPCACGGTLREYSVTPRRNASYINHILVCDNPECKEAKSRDGSKEGRRIVY